MDTLQRRIERLTRFSDLLAGQPEHPDAAYLVRECVLILAAVVRDYPETRETLRDSLPKLAELAGEPRQN